MDDNPEFLNLSSDEESKLAASPTTDTALEGETNKPVVTFRGNGYDLMVVVGVTIGGIMLSICFTCGLAQYILPFVPIVLGIIGLVAAKDSVDPERTKLLSWISLGSGGFFLILIFLAVLTYIAFFLLMMAMAAEGG
jgi:hypothetical protein